MCWGCDSEISEGAPSRIFNYGHALPHDGFSIHHVCEMRARKRLLDILVMEEIECREVHAEWAVLARKIAPESKGCDCDVCAIGRALDLTANAGAAS
jgi:hypothetical protein